MAKLKEEITKLKKIINELNMRVRFSSNTKLIKDVSDVSEKIIKLEDTSEGIKNSSDIVKISREFSRPTTIEYIDLIFDDFIELHGDRRFSDDKAIIGGIGIIDSISITVIGHQKGRDVNENIERNFGMAHPEGYRKSLRLMKEAERFKRPIVNFIDTPGAYPGIGAEERGQAEAIAYNLYEMSGLKVPIISIITGEGGSGGALALGIADRVLMLKNSIYSVISPEGCAAILWKDSTKSNSAAEALKLTSKDLYEMGIIDDIISEPDGGAHTDHNQTAENIKKELLKNLNELLAVSNAETLISDRYNKYRKMGVYVE